MKVDPKNPGHFNIYVLGGCLIVPRPIAWISTIGPDGLYNAAPYSAFTRVCAHPFIVAVSIGRRRGKKKDTIRNIEFTNDFVINVVNDELARAMVQTSADYPYGTDEIKKAGLTAEVSDKVKSPRISESPASLECKVEKIIELGHPERGTTLVLAEVVMIHLKDELLKDNIVRPEDLKPLGRLGGDCYCHMNAIFEMKNRFKSYR